jgi:hypothetical protein
MERLGGLGLFFWLLAGHGWGQAVSRDYALSRISVHGEAGGIAMQQVNFPLDLALTPECCDPAGKNRSQATPLKVNGAFTFGGGVTLRPLPGT